jgi:thiamine-monophosphate kinase
MSGSSSAADPAIAAVGEHLLIERLRARAGAPPDWVVLGIGDDAAVLRPERGTLDVLSTDSLVEQVHFRLDLSATRDVGHKALAVNLSDLAAMGATPRAALLSLALPDTLRLSQFDGLIDGFSELAAAVRMPLVGGNLTRSPGPIVIDVTVVGSVRPRRLLSRAGGRAGDELYVTGTLGAAAAGLGMLTGRVERGALDAAAKACVRRYERPDARLRCGQIVGKTRSATACMDVSDGLADAVAQLARASRTGAVVDATDVPVEAGAAAWAAASGGDALTLALSGGEDYELLFAVAPRQRRKFLAAIKRAGALPVTRIGKLTTDAKCWLETGGERTALPAGFGHFRALKT